jgi:puromycin-sensitive aminopeptidase
MMKKSVSRLYDNLKPSHYTLSLQLKPEHRRFSGTVVMRVKRHGRPSQRMTLHQKGLKIRNASITHHLKGADEVVPIDRINAHNAYDELRLHTTKKLLPGDYTITVVFEGKITDPMQGLYPCYFTHEGKEKVLLATQFESHHAREVFPCIDEPEAKATFDMTLVTPTSGDVLANTPAKESRIENDLRTTTFETTPVMSTYLLAFVYGDIGYKEARTKSGTLVRTYATPNNVAFTDFALETATRCLEFYEDYFGIPYPLAKCDMIALPDFASGAMENWGLITYREQCMLVDPKNTSLGTKQYVAMVVAHELAHQWFGNLVTMQWWTDLWLNEGFASWIEYLACDTLFPEWQMWTQFVASEQQAALKLDALENTHAIEVLINHPDEIRTIFDAISYNKGASVIHMLYGYLGANDFRDGLRYYLKQHAYKNAVTADLWAALEHVSGKPVKRFMHAWTSLPGFPLLSVNLTGERVELSQERFYALPPKQPPATVWPIPLLGGHEDPERLDTSTKQYNTKAKDGFWLKMNRGQSGFYRTLYSPDVLDAISGRIDKLEPLDRLGILADAFEAAKAGYGSVLPALALLKKCDAEDNSAVWDIIASSLGELRRVMDDDTVRENIKPFIRTLTAQQLSRLGWQEHSKDSYFDRLLRPTILALSAGADEPTVLKEAAARFKAAKTPEDIHADLRSMIFTTAARHGNQSTFDKLLRFHNQTDMSEERTTLAAALTAFEQPELIDAALGLITTKTVRRQDAMYWVAYSFMNRHARDKTWTWMREHWHWLDKELGSDLSFYRTPIYAARSFSSSDFLKEYRDFFMPKSSPALERSIKQGLEILESNIAWKQRDLEAVRRFLA